MAQRHDAYQLLRHGRNLAEAVNHALLKLLDLGIGLHAVELAVERNALVFLWHIRCREHKLQVGVDVAVGNILGVAASDFCLLLVNIAERVGKLLGF